VSLSDEERAELIAGVEPQARHGGRLLDGLDICASGQPFRHCAVKLAAAKAHRQGLTGLKRPYPAGRAGRRSVHID
jgi:hypothetical protein